MLRFRKRYALWLALASLFQTNWAGAQVFRVATYNIENYLDHAVGTRPAKPPEGKVKVCESILAIKPDVIALEEVGSTNELLELQAALKKGGLDLPNWDLVNGYDTNIHVAVLTRFAIVARHPHTNETFLLAGQRLHVSRGFADLDIQVNPHFQFTLIAAHLKSKRPTPLADEEEWRDEEATALRRIIDAHLNSSTAKLIVLGDFNDLQDSNPIRTIRGRGRTRLFDTRPAERNGDDPSGTVKSHETRTVAWTHFYAKDDVYSRIDYIMTSHSMQPRWLPKESYVLSLSNWGVASDHRPVVAGFLARDK